jgi:mono/diheme cytochrome c family protein
VNTSYRARMTFALAIVVSTSAIMGCRGQTSKETPVQLIRNMFDQPKYSMQSYSDYFDDHRTMRLPPEGTIAREREIDPRIARGRVQDEQGNDTGYVMTVPQEVIARAGGMSKLLERGQDRFGIYCVPCHDSTGSGEGEVTKHAKESGAQAFAPPTFHQDRIRHMPDGQMFATISNGIRNMPPYGPQVPVNDRWAIISYVRALELSQASLGPESKL